MERRLRPAIGRRLTLGGREGYKGKGESHGLRGRRRFLTEKETEEWTTFLMSTTGDGRNTLHGFG